MTKTLWAHLSFSYVGAVPSANLRDYVYFSGYVVGYKYVQTVHGYAQVTVDYATETDHYADALNMSAWPTVDGNKISPWQGFGVSDSFALTPPDLTVKLNSVTPTTVASGANITLDFTVTNKGTQSAGSNKVGIYMSDDAIITKSDTLIGYVPQGVLDGKGTNHFYNVTPPNGTVIPGGPHYIGVIVDTDNQVNEGTGEGNNASNAIRITSVAPSPADLKVTLKSATPSSVASNGSLHLDYTLTNSGDTAAIAPATVFYLSKDAKIDKSDLFLGSITVDLAGKETYSNDSYAWGLYDAFPAGKYYLGAIIDWDGTTKESNEGNNVSNVVAVTITGKNDAPIGVADTVRTNYETEVEIDVLANDSDPNPGDKLHVELYNDGFHDPARGTVKINPDQTLTYTPNDGYFGKDTFYYILHDDHGGVTTENIVHVDVGWDDVVKNKGKLRASSTPYEWDFEIPEGAQGTYTFQFEITKPTTMHALVTSAGPVTAPIQFHPELIADLGNKAPTLGPGPDRIGRGDKGYMSEEGTSQIFDDPLMPGKYSFEILRQTNDTGPADGHIQLFLSPDEAGNRIEWAAPARTGSTIKGMVDRIDNKDIYKFTLKEQSSVAVSLAVAGLTNKADGVPAIHYEIITNAGSTDYYQVLGDHMATSAFIDTAYTAPDLTDVSNAPLDAGDYYVIIYHPLVQPFNEDTTDERFYNLWINTWADHAANRPLTTDFGAEGPKSANIGDLTNKSYANRDFLGLADGNDYYMFSLSQRSTVKMALTQPSKDVSMDLEFASMSGGSIAAQLVDAVGDGAGSRTIVATLDAGTYMLRAHTDTAFGNTTAANGYGLPLVLPHKGGSTYDLKITSSTTLTTMENGTSGDDNYLGSSGQDKFNGKAGNDRLQGKGGNDNLIGDIGDDIIDGGDGDDFLIGGMGADKLTGGAGSDTFMYLKAAEGGDTVVDFTPGQDKVGIVKAGFGITKVAVNAADPNFDFALHYFVRGAGAVATEAHGQFVFDTASHSLYWDANGNAAGGTTLLATFSNGANLSASDIDIKY